MPQRKLEQILLNAKIIDPADLASAAADAARTQTRLAWNLISSGAIDERKFAKVVGDATGTEILWMLPEDIPPWIYRRIPAPIARQYQAVPLDMIDGKMRVAVVDPMDHDGLEVLTAVTNLPIVPVVALKSALDRLLNRVYPFDVDVDATKFSEREVDAGDSSMAINAVAEPGVQTIAASIPVQQKTSETADSRVAALERELERIAALLDDARRQLTLLKNSRG